MFEIKEQNKVIIEQKVRPKTISLGPLYPWAYSGKRIVRTQMAFLTFIELSEAFKEKYAHTHNADSARTSLDKTTKKCLIKIQIINQDSILRLTYK